MVESNGYLFQNIHSNAQESSSYQDSQQFLMLRIRTFLQASEFSFLFPTSFSHF